MNHAVAALQQPIAEVKVGPVQVSAFADMQQLLAFIIREDGSTYAGSAIAINPEKVLTAMRNSEIEAVISGADIRYADGIGVVKVMRRRLKKNVQRIPGCELWQQLMLRAATYKVPVFIVGAKPEVNQQTADKLRAQQVNLVGAVDGYFKDEAALIAQIKQSGARFVSVAMGSPKQELLIQRIRAQHPDCFYMGVGGTYDVFTGNVKRAPELWCKLNLEWAYRLLSQPSRIGRQLGLLRYVWWYFTGKI
ncbi:lipopolysaccharide N-acetylmannosaminouronosyltransferase [Rheinheimera aquimaris]|uniref:Lipopolysaccharide N-acetylmannosaminouronosyltransferase n=1 Tax=Rheinheimera aquimaris TaxID=412437 RepID=A0ABN1DYK2_9GAMM|nr:WecB/TagA/CpsF family glycosyltransferase [Rheinheimera aquimaris]MCB5213655.1 WecB/TagA/CpsF family glycosyltransferase [Rheinheimera aquimaris]